MLLAVSLVAAWEVAMDLDPSGLEPRPIRITADAPSNGSGTRVCGLRRSLYYDGTGLAVVGRRRSTTVRRLYRSVAVFGRDGRYHVRAALIACKRSVRTFTF